MDGHDVVIHLASNPDIARAATEPDIDFWQGTVLTHNVVEAMRTTSGQEDPLRVGQRCLRRSRRRSRPGGPRPDAAGVDLRRQQAGGRGVDLQLRVHVRSVGLRLSLRQRRRPAPDARCRLRFRAPPAERADGAAHPGRRQPEQVVHPRHRRGARRAGRARQDASSRFASTTSPPATTSRWPRSPSWRSSASACAAPTSSFEFTGGDRGWKGDVPVVRLDTQRIQTLGWRCQLSSREALRQSMLAMIPDMKEGRM